MNLVRKRNRKGWNIFYFDHVIKTGWRHNSNSTAVASKKYWPISDVNFDHVTKNDGQKNLNLEFQNNPTSWPGSLFIDIVQTKRKRLSFFIAPGNNVNVLILAFDNKNFLLSWEYKKSSAKRSMFLLSLFATKLIVYINFIYY